MYKRALHIFRRDLRISDNTALISAMNNSEEVLPCFILDPRQVRENEYRSENAVSFMIESIFELEKEISKHGTLLLEKGKAEDVVQHLINKYKIDAVYINSDYSPFSKKRDERIKELCRKLNVDFMAFDDCLLNSPNNIFTNNNTPYTIFTPFYKKAKQYKIPKPKKSDKKNFTRYKGNAKLSDYYKETPARIKGGRTRALHTLRNLKSFGKYETDKDIPAKDCTTKLSAHLKFGTISPREFYYAVKDKLGISHPLIRQLYWRDFWTYIGYHFPHVFGKSFHKKYDRIKWENDKKKFQAWCSGRTGFPIVDAGMRELNDTGFMHNRLRMITASFLTKDLQIDWRWGEKYFAQMLVDYDPAVNNGNWQWAASTGCDAQPFFRIFNPWRQQARFDKDCNYIKKWVPEVRNLGNKIIHNLNKEIIEGYPKPMIEHKTEADRAKAMYRMVN